MNKYLILISTLILSVTLLTTGLYTTRLSAQSDEEEKVKQEQQRAEAVEALTTLDQLLQNRQTQQQSIKRLKAELRAAKEDVTKKEIEATLKSETEKLERTEQQISALTAGITEEAYYERETKKFNLQDELQNLAEPFVKMVKSTTETARQIDTLKLTISDAIQRQAIAESAIDRIQTLIKTNAKTKSSNLKATSRHLEKELKNWVERQKEAANLQSTSEQQLALKQKAAANSNLENYATGFIRTRGLNLLIAILTFFGTFMLLRGINKLAGVLFHRKGRKHSFYSRLIRLLYQVFTILGATLMMMIVLNHLNDWILLGVAGLFTIALAWIGLKMLPVLTEQAILLLNLGAVQEGERLMIDGVPWFVKRLDHYTVLENPALDGGHFTVPIRELVGRHSRPPARDEAWFPTKKDDWVQLQNGTIAKVVIQTPELVQLVELGGARITYLTTEFLNTKIRNISTGFRITMEFGISYKHQHQATDIIPAMLHDHIKTGLDKFIDQENLLDLEIELFRAGSSSIDYEIEADCDGKIAHRYEDIEGEITRLAIEACNKYELEIPYPQLVIHKPE